MKRLLVRTTAVLLISSGAAYAADLTEPAPATFEERVASNFDWSGAYVGVNVGGGFGTFDHPFAITAPAPVGTVVDGSVDISAGGFLGGVQAGYNWQNGDFVFGAEADFQGSAVKAEDSLSVNTVPPFGAGSIDGEAGTKVKWFGTVRARAGVSPVDRLLVYGTAGLAYGKVESYLNANVTGGGPIGNIDVSKSNTKAGWTVGAGAEYAVTNNWTIKSEYLYTDLGKTTLINADLFGANATLKNDVSFHTIRIGLNYKF
ncbi:outer membrane protein [Shinella zoogloeoides]|uniref:Outer membrane beta-barrel protein n=1 Tax=Shinella zoogloeoides TaxID=352475 RepID=A0A6N8TGA8_SHIZO|nr:outer membrane protein [Shinella zoogloeoides]MXO01455.1 outer membrane beta-barrel protein [Shinella zoogloeoides]UEX83674.1 porin family protein [Shinella zoogloeoides]